MSADRYVTLREISQRLHIEVEVCHRFADHGLIEITFAGDTPCVEPTAIQTLYHAASLYRDLGINVEGIEAILAMRDQIRDLQRKVDRLDAELDRMRREFRKQNVERPRRRGILLEIQNTF